MLLIHCPLNPFGTIIQITVKLTVALGADKIQGDNLSFCKRAVHAVKKSLCVSMVLALGTSQVYIWYLCILHYMVWHIPDMELWAKRKWHIAEAIEDGV